VLTCVRSAMALGVSSTMFNLNGYSSQTSGLQGTTSITKLGGHKFTEHVNKAYKVEEYISFGP